MTMRIIQQRSVTLESAKNYPHNELWCVFQPHTYSRTIAFLDDFAKALSLCDHVIVTDIYATEKRYWYRKFQRYRGPHG